jgi:hypothetical protein
MIRRLVERFRRPPDFAVGGWDNPYMLRWWLTPWSGWFRDVEINPEAKRWRKIAHRIIRLVPGAYLHKFLRDDDDRALHDHPWWSLSIIICGAYIEHLQDGSRRFCNRWSITFRRAKHRHRIELYNNVWVKKKVNGEWVDIHYKKMPAWTIFITGPKIREWGFWCPSYWTGENTRFIHWKKFVSATDRGNIGRGCDQ